MKAGVLLFLLGPLCDMATAAIQHWKLELW